MSEKGRYRGSEIKRFSVYRIMEHWVHVIIFLILVLTGLSQSFYYLDISQWFILAMGGIDNTRIVHRYTGAFFLILTLIHIMVAAAGTIFKKWQPSLVITKKDVKDAIHNIKYYFGIARRPARCGRYNYKQKFEYWGILLGVLIMITSGLVLWFPSIATKYMSGEVVPAAKALHSNEALVIVLIIAIWHIYNAIFSPEVFPLDKSIFTGYISRKRMEREHPLELESDDSPEQKQSNKAKFQKYQQV